MANPTLQQIATQSLGATATSVTFSAIPQTYTDLKLVLSIEGISTSTPQAKISFNGSTSNFTGKELNGFNGISSGTQSNTYADGTINVYNSTSQGSNIFTNNEIYISNYTSNNYKSLFSNYAMELNPSASAYIYLGMFATLWSSTAAITSITLTAQTSKDFQPYSTFTLYGIRNY